MTTTFPLMKVQRLREKAAARAQPLIDGPERWSKSSVDPMKVLAVFKNCLWIKDGFILRAYQRWDIGIGSGVVWAMPADAEFPDPYDCKKDRKRVLQPPRPPAALNDEMEAIDGDGSPWSYLCASILGREFWTFGRFEIERGWNARTIVGENPWKGKRRANDLGDPAQWRWYVPAPKEWKPQVTEDEGKVTVTFYCYSGHGGNHISRYKDTYRKGSYCHKSRVRDIATGTGGFEFDTP